MDWMKSAWAMVVIGRKIIERSRARLWRDPAGAGAPASAGRQGHGRHRMLSPPPTAESRECPRINQHEA